MRPVDGRAEPQADRQVEPQADRRTEPQAKGHVGPPVDRKADRQRVAAARLWAVTRLPYLASALFAISVEDAPGSRTVAVDPGWRLHADPEVVASLDAGEFGRLLVHLTAHLLRDHAARAAANGVSAPGGDPARWNRAADAEINDDLVADECVPPVAPDLPADLGQAPGGLAETYFAEQTPGPRHWDCGSGADGSPRPWDGAGYAIDVRQAELMRIGTAAEIQRLAAQQPGTVPGGWLRWAETMLPSRVDWRRVLAAEIRRGIAAVAGSVDYTYRRPSRRAAATRDVVLPSLYRPVPDVAIVCDTSGSMHEGLLARALAEVEGLLARAGLRQGRIRVLAVDSAVQVVRRVTRATQVRLAGGGGTDMGTGIEAAAALRPQPSIVVVLTDGYTPWPDRPPKGVKVVIGLLTEGGPPPPSPPGWARTVLIEP